MRGVESEQSPLDDAVDRVLRASDGTLRRSFETIRSLDAGIASGQAMLEALDGTLERAGWVLRASDVDLQSFEPPSRPSGSLRVLVVDDNPAIRRSLRLLLAPTADTGVEVRTVDSGEQALEQVAWQPELVILDWQMSSLDGPATARLLRAHLPATRIVLYSATPGVGGGAEARAAGADRFLSKGTSPDALVAEVRAAERRRLRQRS
jgi:CheY-like chemotaxis protein